MTWHMQHPSIQTSHHKWIIVTTHAQIAFNDPWIGPKVHVLFKVHMSTYFTKAINEFFYMYHQIEGTGHLWKLSMTIVFSLGVSQIMPKIANLWTFWLIGHSICKDNNRKNTLVALGYFVCFQMHIWKASAEVFLFLFEWEIASFSKTPLIVQREPFPQCFIQWTVLHCQFVLTLF